MISPDVPITKSSEDRLDRQSFAESLARILSQVSFPTSFTVGLYGPWGSGKTSLLNMVLEQVESQNEEVVILRFNPWLCSDPKQLITQFFKQLASAIKIKKPASDAICELVDQYADIFDAAALIPYAGGAIAAIGKFFAGIAKKRTNKKNGDLQGKKDEIVRKMDEEHIRIIVSIDDIDRLSEKEIVAVFQLIKSLADFPNTVYLIAFDYEVVVRALSTVQHGDGREYLEKIIQVPFEVPAPSMTSIHNMLFAQLDKILGDIPKDRWDKEAWAELFQYGVKEYIQSIRDVIRYSNVFYLKYELLREETDPVDLLGLTCLQVFEPVVYSLLSHYKNELCGQISSYSYEYRNNEEEKIKQVVNEIIPTDGVVNEKAAKQILGVLFPKTNVAFGNNYTFGRYYDHRKFLINCNIAVSECFDRYFSLSLEDQAIPAAIIRRIVYEANESELFEKIEGLYQEGKTVRLLEEIEAYANKGDLHNIPSERAALLISCICKMWNSFEVDEEGFFTVPFTWRLLFCVHPLLKSLDTTERFAFLQKIFADHEVATATLALLLQDFEMQHGRFTDSESPKDPPVISLDELLKLEAVFRERCVESLNTGEALSQNNGLDFLWLLGKIDDGLVKRIKENLVTDDIFLAKVISCCTSHGKMGTKLVVKTRQVSKKDLSEFIDIEEARRRVDTFITTHEFLRLPKENQMDVVAFCIAMRRDSKDEPTKDAVAEEVIEEELQKIVRTIQAKVF